MGDVDIVDCAVDESLDASELLPSDLPIKLDSEEKPPSLPKTGERRYENKFGSFVTGFDVSSEEAERRRNERARRFGVEEEEDDEDDEKTVDIESSKKVIEKLAKPVGSLRPEAIFLAGTDKMSTKDVLGLFKVYGPSCIEWINDSSCNVVWEDGDSATRALTRLGKTIICEVECQKVECGDVEMSETDDVKPATREDDDRENRMETESPLDESSDKDYWRVGPSHRKAEHLLIRRARTGDCKEKGSSKYSRYYMLHGNPNIAGRPRGISTQKLRMIRKRRRESEDDEEMTVDPSKKSALTFTDECMTEIVEDHATKRDSRLRMRADDELRGVDAWDRDREKIDEVPIELPKGLPVGDLRGKLRPHRDLRKVLESRREEDRPGALKIKANLEDKEGDREVLLI